MGVAAAPRRPDVLEGPDDALGERPPVPVADEAPGADNVGPDVDTKGHVNLGCSFRDRGHDFALTHNFRFAP